MFNLNFKNNYRVVHINNELGNCIIGGAGTYMNELYKYRTEDTGFIYMGLGSPTDDYNVTDFMEQKDILIMNKDEAYKLADINCEVLVVQFYEFASLLDEDIIKNKTLAYVIHSVPTPEPPPPWDPFGGNHDIREKFEKLCELASVLVCVSEAEKEKLSKIYPQYEEKIEVVHNGITYDISTSLNVNYKHTCSADGYTGDLYCTDCGKVLDVGETIPKTGVHVWEETVDGDTVTKTCTECGKTVIESGGDTGNGDDPDTEYTDVYALIAELEGDEEKILILINLGALDAELIEMLTRNSK